MGNEATKSTWEDNESQAVRVRSSMITLASPRSRTRSRAQMRESQMTLHSVELTNSRQLNPSSNSLKGPGGASGEGNDVVRRESRAHSGVAKMAVSRLSSFQMSLKRVKGQPPRVSKSQHGMRRSKMKSKKYQTHSSLLKYKPSRKKKSQRAASQNTIATKTSYNTEEQEDSEAEEANRMNWFQGESRFLITNTETTKLVRKKFRELGNRLSVRVKHNLDQANRSMVMEEKTVANNSPEPDVRGEQELPARRTISKAVLKSEWRRAFGHTVDLDLFNKLFEMMDCDRDGIVDETEFTVIICFLLKKGSAKDNTGLAFNLFDVNKDGGISQQEFSEMLATVIGTQMENVLKIEKIKRAFEKYAKKEFCEENLMFFCEILPLRKPNLHDADSEDEDEEEEEEREESHRPYQQISIERAIAFNEEYIQVGSSRMINISSMQRDSILKKVNEAEGRGDKKISAKVYEVAFQEVKYLLEAGALPRFKEALRKPPFSSLTHDAWGQIGLDATEVMDYPMFEEWSESTPGLFDFLKEIQNMFTESFKSVAHRWAVNESQEFYTVPDEEAPVTPQDV